MGIHIIKSYATIATNKDLVADGGSACSVISCGTAGDLVVTPEGNPGADQVVTFAAGVPQYLRCIAIKASGTTAAKVTVGWS